MIRLMIVDDHPAMRAGLWGMLRAEPGITPTAAAESVEEARDMAATANPDVVLVDYQLGSQSGLVLCRALKATPDPPRVLVYSAYSELELVVPALLAGADGVLGKASSPEALCDGIRTVFRGDSVIPQFGPERLQAIAARLSSDELPILGMVMDGTSEPEVARTLGISGAEVARRIDRMIERLTPEGRDRLRAI